MNNCFVTKITDSIPNDATHNPMLHKINEFVIKAKPLAIGKISIPSISSTNSIITIDVLGKGTLHSNKDSKNNNESFTVDSLDDLYLKVSDVDNVNRIAYNLPQGASNVVIFDINTLRSCLNLNYLSSNNSNVTGDISSLSELTNITYLSTQNTDITGNIGSLSELTNLTTLSFTNGKSITGDISSLSELTNLTTLQINSTGITGDINTLAKLTQLTSVNTSNCALSGTIESLANEIAKAKVAHVLKIWTLGASDSKCTITYNGNKAVKRVWTITFAADGTYTVENTDS